MIGFATGDVLVPDLRDEAGQAVDFIVYATTTARCSRPWRADDRSRRCNLIYTPAANANGSATVTVQIHDNGGGADTSAAQTFVITVNAVNDAPTLVATAVNPNYTPGADLFRTDQHSPGRDRAARSISSS